MIDSTARANRVPTAADPQIAVERSRSVEVAQPQVDFGAVLSAHGASQLPDVAQASLGTTPATPGGIVAPGVGTGSTVARVASGVAQGVLSILPGGAALSRLAGGGTDPQFEALLRLQREGQAFNVQYLSLQESLQRQNREFTAVSNVLKARHETAQSAISNLR